MPFPYNALTNFNPLSKGLLIQNFQPIGNPPPPPGSFFRITDASEIRITDDGDERVTD